MKYIGHIGYRIEEPYRGNKYSAKACLLIKNVAIEHGMKKLIITCNPDNYASRKICEIIGTRLVEIVDIPETSEVCSAEDTKKCRYEWVL